MGKAEHPVRFAVLFLEPTCVSPVFVKSKHVQHPGTAPPSQVDQSLPLKGTRGLGVRPGRGWGSHSPSGSET